MVPGRSKQGARTSIPTKQEGAPLDFGRQLAGNAASLLLPTGEMLEEAHEESEMSPLPRADEATPPQGQRGPCGEQELPSQRQ